MFPSFHVVLRTNIFPFIFRRSIFKRFLRVAVVWFPCLSCQSTSSHVYCTYWLWFISHLVCHLWSNSITRTCRLRKLDMLLETSSFSFSLPCTWLCVFIKSVRQSFSFYAIHICSCSLVLVLRLFQLKKMLCNSPKWFHHNRVYKHSLFYHIIPTNFEGA